MRPSAPLDPMTATPSDLMSESCRGLAFGQVGSGRQRRSSALHEAHRGAHPPKSPLLVIPASTGPFWGASKPNSHGGPIPPPHSIGRSHFPAEFMEPAQEAGPSLLRLPRVRDSQPVLLRRICGPGCDRCGWYEFLAPSSSRFLVSKTSILPG